MTGSIKMTMDLKALERFARRSPKLFEAAMAKAGIQFLNWANNGSKRSDAKPPIRWGVLRGSSSVFIGGKLVSVAPARIKPGAPDKPTPNRAHSGPPLTLTFGWNTDYATRMHEELEPAGPLHQGPFTENDPGAGPKWLEEHLEKDRNDLMEMVAVEFRKAAGT